jgi:hypothetical protein
VPLLPTEECLRNGRLNDMFKIKLLFSPSWNADFFLIKKCFYMFYLSHVLHRKHVYGPDKLSGGMFCAGKFSSCKANYCCSVISWVGIHKAKYNSCSIGLTKLICTFASEKYRFGPFDKEVQ